MLGWMYVTNTDVCAGIIMEDRLVLRNLYFGATDAKNELINNSEDEIRQFEEFLDT